MKVLIVSDARSIHTKRWTLALKNKGLDVILFTLHKPVDDFYKIGRASCRERV